MGIFVQMINTKNIFALMGMKKKFKLFDATRIKYEELKSDITNYIKAVYNTNGVEMNTASPFMQVLYVVGHLGRMILFYIESAMNETNINTAVHERSIRAISTLTGHNPSRGIAARGGVTLTYNRTTENLGNTIHIKNYSKIRNSYNGLEYIMVFPADVLDYTLGVSASQVNVSIIQGVLTYQRATGTGAGMQSFNFPAGAYDIVDDFYVNVYVNGERWTNAVSFIDMTYNEKACIVKTSANTGIDVFFGNNTNGAVPEKGAIITVEYLVCSGATGNVPYESELGESWEFVDQGYMSNGESVDLNDIFVITPDTDIMFGANGEDISVTRALAPHASRSYVLANQTNYEYFLRRLNMFSVIDTIQGFNSYEDNQAQLKYNIAERDYVSARESYYAQLNMTGSASQVTKDKYAEFIQAQERMEVAKNNLENSKLDDNVVYLFLVPKLSTRIDDTNNYFTCSIDAFKLTEKEKANIIELLDNSGQKLLTVDNEIIDPKMPKFAINIFIQMWQDFEFSSVKSSIIDAVSNYLLENTRRDRIPVSDFIRVVEEVPGVDSVSVVFDADRNNQAYYGEGNYGIDEYGDIVMSRNITDVLGNTIEVQDLFPLFRGGFVSKNGVEYTDDMGSLCGPINITLRGKTSSKIGNKITMIK